MNTFKRKNLFVAILAGLAVASCALSKKQIEALGPGPKTVCFHARCDDSLMCGGNWSTTTNAMAASEGRGPSVTERCEVNAPRPQP